LAAVDEAAEFSTSVFELLDTSPDEMAIILPPHLRYAIKILV
jgi:hypothetical protein